MALNVEQITTRLAQMPDAALQKYAAMNKNDPYIVALAVSESNRRKQMRQAAQGQAGMQPQPKVVDQDIAQMAPAAPAQPMPEDMGIARLPAGAMNFADGGIVAFADGGDVEHYADMGFTGFSFGDWAAADKERRRKKLEEERAANMAAVARGSTYSPEAYGVETPAAPFQDPRLLGAAPGMPLRTPPAGNQPPAAPAPAAKTDTAPRTPGAPKAPAAAPANPNLDVAALTKQALDTAAKAPNPFAADIESVGKEKVAAAESSAKGLKAIHDKFSDIYKGREERLNKREAEIGKMKDQNLGLALLQAGAAMMSTRGSLGTAVGAGIDTGSKQYVAGLDKLNAAKEKLSDARDRLEELNAQRGELTAREQLKAENDIKTAGISAREDLIKSNQQMYGVNRETALKMVDNQIQVALTQFKEGEATKRSAAQIAATLSSPERLVFNSLVKKHNGDVSAAYAEMQSAKREPISREAALKNWTTNQMMITAQNPNIKTFEDYYAQISGGVGGGDGFRVVGVR